MLKLLFYYWDRARSSFDWLLPTILVGGAIALSVVTLMLDQALANQWDWADGLLYTGSADGASTILGTVSGSMITIAGVVFSLTLVALTLASSQFGPRLLRNFRRDPVNQVVIGTFVATFLYCLLVLRSIRREDVGDFVPHLSVTLSVLLALVSLGVLIYFIHHVAVSIQADAVVSRVAAELINGIDRLFPEQIGTGNPERRFDENDPEASEFFEQEAGTICASGDGYLQLINPEALLRLAMEKDALLRIERRPGHYIVSGTPLARVWPKQEDDEIFTKSMQTAFVLGSHRTPTQDIEFSVNQLVEIAVRALSPGVNDPFTAIVCVDRLSSALSRLAQREMPSAYRRDEQNRLRVITPRITFPGLVDAAFNQIRQCARSNAAVTMRMLEAIEVISRFATRPADRAALQRHAEMIMRGAREGLPEEEDRRDAEERYRIVLTLLGTIK